MKRRLFLFLFVVSAAAFAQAPATPKNLPSVEGSVFESKMHLAYVNVNVYNKERLILSKKTDSLGNYSLTFNIDSVYTVELSKENYITKKYEVCTKEITKERLKQPFNKIVAHTDMHKAVEGVDYTVYKKPMVKFFYDKKNDKFDIDTKHFSKSFNNQKKITEEEKKAVAKQKAQKKKEGSGNK